MIWVNFKTYKQGTGKKALELAKICEGVGKGAGVKIIPLVQAADIFRVVAGVKIPVWGQHVDEISFGPNTGGVLAEAVWGAGASGVILNHSEKKLPFEIIGETVRRVKDLGMKVLVCAESVEEGEEVVKFKPDFLAYEPPELIGSREVSVATGKPEVITDFVKKFPQLPIVVGAGIHGEKDVMISLRLGAKGILVSSDVVLAPKPEEELEELTKPFKGGKN